MTIVRLLRDLYDVAIDGSVILFVIFVAASWRATRWLSRILRPWTWKR